jgi:[citrate (pro-3S)-lyase] ligase
MAQAGLHPDIDWEQTVLVWDGTELAAAGSRNGNLLKCIAVDPGHRGEDLTATVLTQLRTEAFRCGHSHLFLYTKPENRLLFESLFFYPIAQTDKVLLMENKQGGIQAFLDTLPQGQPGKKTGAAVMNCNPFTLGHRYLIETAAKECDRLYVFVLSEDKSRFSAAQRLEMVRLGTADLPNVTVLPTGPYLISSATFPTYFLKDREQAGSIQCLLDIEIFANHFVPRFGITHRYVGTEPLSPMTAQYNEALKAQLPGKGITLREIPRLETEAGPVSASAVRAALEENRDIRGLVPESTLHYLGGINHG